MHTRSDNIKIIIGDETDKIIEELFESLFAKMSKKFRKINDRK